LAFGRPDRIKALALGGTTGGRTSSAQWTAGGFTEGTPGEYEQDVLSQYGISALNGMQGNARALMRWQAEKGSKISPAAATFGVGPQGTGEITGISEEGLTKMSSAIGDGVKEGVNKALENKSPNANKFVITEEDLEKIKGSFVDAFSKIGTEIITETMKRIKEH